MRNLSGKPLSKCGVETILNNPFYTGIIEIKRTRTVYEGAHEPIITHALFQRVQDIKSGRTSRKVTRHRHTYQGLFRCGLCQAAMTPERQKGRVYYRCQTPSCPTKTLREDQIEAQLVLGLLRHQIVPTDAKRLATEWHAWIEQDDQQEKKKSVELQLSQVRSRMDRLTDLIIDGTLSREEFDARKRSLTLEQARLAEDLENADRPGLDEQTVSRFLELMKNLAMLHEIAKPSEKRWLAQNCFSNRQIKGKELYLEPYDWLICRDLTELSSLVHSNDPLIELLSKLSK